MRMCTRGIGPQMYRCRDACPSLQLGSAHGARSSPPRSSMPFLHTFIAGSIIISAKNSVRCSSVFQMYPLRHYDPCSIGSFRSPPFLDSLSSLPNSRAHFTEKSVSKLLRRSASRSYMGRRSPRGPSRLRARGRRRRPGSRRLRAFRQSSAPRRTRRSSRSRPSRGRMASTRTACPSSTSTAPARPPLPARPKPDPSSSPSSPMPPRASTASRWPTPNSSGAAPAPAQHPPPHGPRVAIPREPGSSSRPRPPHLDMCHLCNLYIIYIKNYPQSYAMQ